MQQIRIHYLKIHPEFYNYYADNGRIGNPSNNPYYIL